MKRLGYKDMLISVDELIELCGKGISAKYIMNACNRTATAIKEKQISWINEPDPNDGRKILIRYSSIPKQTISKYSLPTVEALIEQFKLEAEQIKYDRQQHQIEFKEDTLKRCLKEAVTEQYVKYCPRYSKQVIAKTANAKKAKVIELAKTHAALQSCIDLKAGYKISELHEAYLAAEGVKHSLKSLEKFRQKLVDGERNGLTVLHKHAGQPRECLVKLTDWHKAKIMEYYGNPQKFTVKMVHMLLTHDCNTYGKTLVSLETVAKYVQRPEIKNAISVVRDQAYYRRVVQPSTRRIDPTFAGDLYYCDGSPVQIFCKDQTGKKDIRLNLFVVMDVKSKKIVGFDLSESEDRYNWFAAFKMAFATHDLIPYEMMYDHASATKTDEFKALKEALATKGCILNPTAKGEPKQKADVERWFNTFQTGYQRMIDGFYGEGIRSKRDNGRIDLEHLNRIDKLREAYTTNDMVEIVTNLIAIYNASANKTGKSPNTIFAESEKPNVQQVDASDIAMLFWAHKPLKVTNSEIRITIRHNEYYYEVYEHLTALKLDGRQVNVYYDINDLSSVQVFDMTGNYVCECRQKVQIKKAKANQIEGDALQAMKQSKHNDAKKRVAKNLVKEIIETGKAEDSESFAVKTSPYEVSKKDALNDAETKRMLSYMQAQREAKFKDDYQSVDTIELVPETPNKLQQKHSKKYQVPGTLAPINRP